MCIVFAYFILSINTSTCKCRPFYLLELSRKENNSAASMRENYKINGPQKQIQGSN
jgi:hypothetical protein